MIAISGKQDNGETVSLSRERYCRMSERQCLIYPPGFWERIVECRKSSR